MYNNVDIISETYDDYIQSNPIQSNLFKSGNKAHTDTLHTTIYTVEIKPKIKPTGYRI